MAAVHARWFFLAIIACSSGSHVESVAPRASTCGAPLPAGASKSARQQLQTAHGNAVTQMAESADGYLATTSQFDHTIRIWNLQQSTLVTVLQEHAPIAWDDDAHALLLQGLGERAKDGEFISPDLLVAPDGHTLGSRVGEWTFVHEAGRTRAAVKTPSDHAALVYTGRDQRVHHLVLPKNSYSMSSLAVNDDGTELVAMVGYALLRWPLADEPSTPVVREVPDLTTAVFANTGDALILAGGTISFAPRDVAVPLRPISQGDIYTSHLAIARDGSLGFVASHSALIAFDLATGTTRWSERGVGFDSHRIHTPGVGFFGIMLANDGRRLFVARDDGSVVLRDVTTGRDLGSLGAAVHQPTTVAWVDNTHVLASENQRVVVWDTTTGTIESAYTETRGFLSARVVGGDVVVARMTLCLGGGNATTIAWPDRWKGRTPPAELLAGTMPDPMSACGNLGGIAWPPPRGMATGAMRLGGAGHDFDLTSGRSLAATSAHIDAVRTSDGAVIKLAGFTRPFDTALAGDFVLNPAKAGASSVVGVWRASDGARLADLAVTYTDWNNEQRQEGIFIGASDDGTRVAVRGGDVIGVFETATGKLLQSMHTGREIETAVGFSPDPKQFWVGARSGAILRVAADGTVHTLGNGTGALVSRLSPSPDGTRLLAMGDDGGLRIVDAATGDVRATLVEFADDEPLAFTPSGAYGGTAEAASRVGWRFDAPVEIFRFEQFAQAFHRPELVTARLAGKRDDATAGLTRPPAVELAPSPPTTAEAKTTLAIKFASSRRVDVVRAYREGREVAFATPCAPTGSLALDVPLLAGGNTITVQAFDDLGYASNPAVAQITRTTGPQPDLYIVSVGVGAYPNLAQEFQLQLATADATGIASAFRDDVGPRKQFGAVHPTVLLDAQVTVPAVLAALDGLAKMKPDDLAIVFMAGHGIKPTPEDDMVFVTSTASLTPASLRASGLGWSAVSERLARAKGRVIVLLDACHSGHVSQNLVVPNDQLAASLSRNGRAGVVVFAAAKGRQSSFEPTGARGLVLHEAAVPLVHGPGDHGFFTGALLASLHDPASDRNGDGVLELSEWVHATSERVSLATEGQQTPWVARQEMFGDFAVVGVRKAK